MASRIKGITVEIGARENLISLCKSCHSRIHAERGDRWHNKRD